MNKEIPAYEDRDWLTWEEMLELAQAEYEWNEDNIEPEIG